MTIASASRKKAKNKDRIFIRDSGESIFLFFVFLSLTDFFGFYRLLSVFQNLYVTDIRYLVAFFVSVITIFFCYLKNRRVYFSFNYPKIWGTLFLLIFIEMIYTILNFEQSFLSTLKEAYYYFIPFLVLLAQNQFLHGKGIPKERFINALIKSSIICSLVAILSLILFETLGENVLGIELTSNSFRYGSLRFSVGTIIVIPAVVISFCRIIYKKGKPFDVYNVLLGLIHVVVVSKTRSLFLGLVFVFAIFLLFFCKNKVVSFFSLLFLFTLLIICLIYFPNLTEYLISSISEDDGIMIRFQSIVYYMDQFKLHPFLGMGLLNESKNSVLLHGSRGLFYRDDVGIVGLLNEFGIVGILWVIFYLFHFLRQKNNNYYTLFIKLFSLLLIFDMINLNFFSPYGMFYVYIMLSIDKGIKK